MKQYTAELALFF